MPLLQPFPSTLWQATLLPASFRGIPFGVTDERGAVGRRGRVHEYPFRDQPWTEDLGRRARRYAISAFVLGDDAALQRDALLAACEQKGPGILIHPTLGVLSVQVDPDTPIEWSLRLDEGRSIEIRLSFVEPGTVLYPTNAADTQAQTNSAADNATNSAMGDGVASMSGNGNGPSDSQVVAAAGGGSGSPSTGNVASAGAPTGPSDTMMDAASSAALMQRNGSISATQSMWQSVLQGAGPST